MSFLDLILILILVLVFSGAVYLTIANRRKGKGCSGPSQDCSTCRMGSCDRHTEG